MRVTLKTVNDRLAELGYDARLEKGDGYFYFSGGEAMDWLDQTVKVPILSSLTLDQWVDEFRRLKKLGHAPISGQKEATLNGILRPVGGQTWRDGDFFMWITSRREQHNETHGRIGLDLSAACFHW
jgi:hypothetical protein